MESEPPPLGRYTKWFDGRHHARKLIRATLRRDKFLSSPELSLRLARRLKLVLDPTGDDWVRFRQAVNFHAASMAREGEVERRYDYEARSMSYRLLPKEVPKHTG